MKAIKTLITTLFDTIAKHKNILIHFIYTHIEYKGKSFSLAVNKNNIFHVHLIYDYCPLLFSFSRFSQS